MRTVERRWEDFAVGEVHRTITEADVVLHAEQTGDLFPHHVDAEWCATQPFGRRIAHGILVLTHLYVITKRAAEEDPGA